MARVQFVKQDEVTGKAKEAYDALASQGKLTNMKQALLQDYATYDAFMGWYTYWWKSSEKKLLLFMPMRCLLQTDAFCAPYFSSVI